MKYIAIKLIKFYQNHLSKHKKGGCSYRIYKEQNNKIESIKHYSGCSGVILRVIRRYGFWKGLFIAKKRLNNCGMAYQKLKEQQNNVPKYKLKQAGFIDCDCGGCDIPEPTNCNYNQNCDPIACSLDFLEVMCTCSDIEQNKSANITNNKKVEENKENENENKDNQQQNDTENEE